MPLIALQLSQSRVFLKADHLLLGQNLLPSKASFPASLGLLVGVGREQPSPALLECLLCKALLASTGVVCPVATWGGEGRLEAERKCLTQGILGDFSLSQCFQEVCVLARAAGGGGGGEQEAKGYQS